MQYFAWDQRLRIFKGTLDKIVACLDFKTPHERNTIAKILEDKAMFLRYENDVLLSKTTEVPTECQGFERSAPVIASDRGRLSSIAHE